MKNNRYDGISQMRKNWENKELSSAIYKNEQAARSPNVTPQGISTSKGMILTHDPMELIPVKSGT